MVGISETMQLVALINFLFMNCPEIFCVSNFYGIDVSNNQAKLKLLIQVMKIILCQQYHNK
jgi:hypothetical protein